MNVFGDTLSDLIVCELVHVQTQDASFRQGCRLDPVGDDLGQFWD